MRFALPLALTLLLAAAPPASAASFLRLDGATAGAQAGVSVAGAATSTATAGRRDRRRPYAEGGGVAYVVFGPFAQARWTSPSSARAVSRSSALERARSRRVGRRRG